MDLREILQVGDKLYSLICGRCKVTEVNDFFIVVKNEEGYYYQFHHNGYYEHSVECMLFPSNGCRDWNNFDTLLIRPPKKGEYLVSHSGIIFISTGVVDNNNRSGVVCWINPDKEGVYIPKKCDKFIYPMRHATEEEIENYDKKLLNNGFVYDSISGELLITRLRAEERGVYWYITSALEVHSTFELFSDIDNARYKMRNYFISKEKAIEVLNKLKEWINEQSI